MCNNASKTRKILNNSQFIENVEYIFLEGSSKAINEALYIFRIIIFKVYETGSLDLLKPKVILSFITLLN